MVRVRVLGTDYGSSWVRELTWALLPGGELFAAAADPRGNFEDWIPNASGARFLDQKWYPHRYVKKKKLYDVFLYFSLFVFDDV